MAAMVPAVVWAQPLPEAVGEAFGLLQSDQIPAAVSAFEVAIETYPDLVEARLGLAIALRRLGDDPAAWEAYQAALSLDPDNILALETVGLLGTFRPEWQAQGITALNRLLTLQPDNHEARINRGRLLGYQQRFADAFADLEQVRREDPSNLDALLGLAEIRSYAGEHAVALSLFTTYQEGGRALPESALIAYAIALQGTGDSERALAILEPFSQDPNAAPIIAQALRSLANADAAAGGSAQERAIALYRQIVDNPAAPTASIREAAEFFATIPSEATTALSLYDRLIAAAPDDPILPIQRQILELQILANADSTSPLVQSILSRYPYGFLYPAQARADIRDAIARISSLTPEQELALAQTLVSLDPPDPVLLNFYTNLPRQDAEFLDFRLAQLQLEQNQFEAARETRGRYVASVTDRTPYEAELLLAEIDRREGNVATAQQRLEAVIAAQPSDAETLRGAQISLAGLLNAQGDPRAALAIYDAMLRANPNDLATELARAAVAYDTGIMSEEPAIALIDRWLERYPVRQPTGELLGLVGALPADPLRESLYIALAEADPTAVGVQLRLLQVIAARDPVAAQARLASLREATRGTPAAIAVAYLEADLALAADDLATAAAAYQRILDQSPGDRDATLALANVQLQRGDAASAVRLYEQIRAQDPTNTDILLALANAYFQQGNQDGAAEIYSELLVADPTNVDYISALAGLRFAQQRYAEAQDLYSQVLALDPGNTTALVALQDLESVRFSEDSRLRPITVLRELQAERREQLEQGVSTQVTDERLDRLSQDFLQRRGITPEWERF